MRKVIDLRVRIEYHYICDVAGCEDIHSNWGQFIGPADRGPWTTDKLIREVAQLIVDNNVKNKDLRIKAIIDHKITDYTLME